MHDTRGTHNVFANLGYWIDVALESVLDLAVVNMHPSHFWLDSLSRTDMSSSFGVCNCEGGWTCVVRTFSSVHSMVFFFAAKFSTGFSKSMPMKRQSVRNSIMLHCLMLWDDWAHNFPSAPSRSRGRPPKKWDLIRHSLCFHVHILANETSGWQPKVVTNSVLQSQHL